MTQTTRSCATCGIPITITSRNPRRRYCTPRCRVADWHQRNRTRGAQAVSGPAPDVANGVGNARTVANAVARTADASPATSITTHARCPRCQSPLTVLTWLLPPAAAEVTTPGPSNQ